MHCATSTDSTPADAEQIKQTEKTTNHDVKAVEYFVKEKLEALGLHKAKDCSLWAYFTRHQQHCNTNACPSWYCRSNVACINRCVKQN